MQKEFKSMAFFSCEASRIMHVAAFLVLYIAYIIHSFVVQRMYLYDEVYLHRVSSNRSLILVSAGEVLSKLCKLCLATL